MAAEDSKEDKDALDALEVEAKEFDKACHLLPDSSKSSNVTTDGPHVAGC